MTHVSANNNAICFIYGRGHDDVDEREDAAFISHAREDVPALLAEVERLLAEVAHLQAENKALEIALSILEWCFLQKVNEMRAREDWLIKRILEENIFRCPMPGAHKCKQRYGLLCCLDSSETESRRQCWRKAADMATRENPGKSGEVPENPGEGKAK